jgi:predicted phage tail protein
MTNIILHGILAKEFGQNFKIKIYKAKNVINAINCNRNNFIYRLKELALEGLNYTIIVDNKEISHLDELNSNLEPKQIDLIPVIIGSGPLAAVIVPLVTSELFKQIAISVAITAITMGLQMMLAPRPEKPPQLTASSKALQESFNFSNRVNVASQGSPVPVGYGRLIVGAQVIQSTIKSYQQTTQANNAMIKNSSKTDTVSSVAVLNNLT